MQDNINVSCFECSSYNRALARCRKYNEPIPFSLDLKPLKCESCREFINNLAALQVKK